MVPMWSFDCFEREVYCIAGLPFDAIDMQQTIAVMDMSVKQQASCFLSTPNLNFLIASLSDADFRNSVIHSDLSVMDGMPLVWIAKLLGIPVRERVAGATLFEVLNSRMVPEKLKVFFFGGPDGVAEEACNAIESKSSGLQCVGFHSPGFVSVDQMSDPSLINMINESGADFVVVALGARKGQQWIERNRASLRVPIISHLGAVVNFVAGSVTRAPRWMQLAGLEWVWRIVQEPALWRRYWVDGLGFVGILLRQVCPHWFFLLLNKHRWKQGDNSSFSVTIEGDICHLAVNGVMTGSPSQASRAALRSASATCNCFHVDVAAAEYLGPGFFGLLLMLKKHMDETGRADDIRVLNVTERVARYFKWNGVEYLLDAAN